MKLSNDILPNRVNQLCKERGVTVKALERELGFGNGTIRRWGSSGPSVAAVAAVAEYFGVSVDWLIGLSIHKSYDIGRFTSQELGFSDGTVRMLCELNSADPKSAETIDALLGAHIESSAFSVLETLYVFMDMKKRYYCTINSGGKNE